MVRTIHIDCADDHPPDRYFAQGDVRVVDSPVGRYREAEAVPLSRFGYRFDVRNVGRPHVAIIRYPDDRRRFMCVCDGTSYDLSTGVLTGFAHQTTGVMLELRQVFWPRWRECSIAFMTWGHGEPAAVASIEIAELDALDALDVPGDPMDGSRREIGIQYEDPCGIGAAEGAVSHAEWEERVTEYARHTGQSLFSYPIVWYHGPRYPSEREPSDDFDVVVAPDRKQYVRWTTEPADWLPGLLERFGDAGIEFQGVVTLLRLGSLMQRMNADLDAIRAGAETINNMLWCDQVQAGTMDWTPTYNCRNYNALIEHGLSVGVGEGFQYAYGERTKQPYPAGPVFNPLHPLVQEAVIGLVGEIAGRYGPYPAFKGIALTMWAPTILWFGSIRSGYDDYTVSLFEAETGISVSVENDAPDRFSKRYEFLTYACRDAWVSWRCRKIRDLLRAMRDAMVAVRPDLRITLNLWSEPFVPAVLGQGRPEHQLGARQSTVGLYRDAGLDVTLFGDEPGIEFDLQLEGGGRDRGSSSDADALLEAFTMFRDHDFLDSGTLGAVGDLPRPGAFIFNAWHEAWGDHRWFPAEPDDVNVDRLSDMSGKLAEGVFRINSEYPPDGFWWDSQLRITPAFYGGGHFMEQYAHAVAELDAVRISRGGLFLDKAHGPEIGAFARAYRALPARKFGTVGETTDPVAVRTLAADDVRYVYLVNRDYYPVAVEMAVSSRRGDVTDLATGEAIAIGDPWRLTLGPYELRSFSTTPENDVRGFTTEAPEDVVAALLARADDAHRAFDAARRTGRDIPGMDLIDEGIRAAAAEGRLAWLRRALTSYAVRKAYEAIGEDIGEG